MRVTVVPGPRGHAIRDRGAKIRRALGLPVIIGVIVLVVATGAILVASSLAGGGDVRALARPGAPVDPPGDDPRDAVEDAIGGVARTSAGIPGVAAAYRYPLGCLGVTLSAERNSMVGRHNPCWHYGVYVTAVLAKVSGEWRLMLQATTPTCPAVMLPAVVRSALIACRRAAAPSLRNVP